MSPNAIFNILKVLTVIYFVCVAWSAMTSLKRIVTALEKEKN